MWESVTQITGALQFPAFCPWPLCPMSGFVEKRGILDKTHPPNFGPTYPTFDPPRPLPLL